MGNVLGSRIRFLREERNLSQVELAKKLTLTNVQLNRYETGKRNPDPETLLSIADFFNVPTDYLLGRIAQLREESPEYISGEDFLILKQLKENPNLYALVHELLQNNRDSELLIRIWHAIHRDTNEH
ncbi:helix-turn-helix domain-containing protein [Sporolactobacillus spathodeae]|uniref:Transcriptional regulator with XRE-family HTH domain n=1 Tax=Sporolactobacillus spathodeae TaxID=1465502 RepID=A0ABS2Q4A4_9BACL|nr:helix-turn-helix transcriptional regulator [Sporolactobacillus spathodeae]MBM7656624.1 transcriptional regulator with XRE-family HTH domain [Sporolactobacillus spathodeae]